MAANEALREANRAITYAAQLAAVGADGLLDTFLPQQWPRPAEPRTASEMTGPSDGTVIE